MSTTKQKLRSEHTIADILRLKPKWFMDAQLHPDKARENLDYIHTMLEYGLGHLANEPFMAVFGGIQIGHAPDRRGELNRAMATYTKRNDAAAANIPLLAPKLTKLGLINRDVLRPALQKNIRQVENELAKIEEELRSIPQNTQSWQRQINDFRTAIETELRRKPILEAKKRALQLLVESPNSGLDPDRLRLLKTIPDDWIVARVDTTRFTLVRRRPITLNYVGTAASGMAKSLYVGFIAIEFDWNLNPTASYQVADCIRYADHTDLSCHPHVSGAHICWGNMTARAERFRETKDYPAFFQLLESLLTTYCPENPYVSFDTMYSRRHAHYQCVSPIFHTKLNREQRREILVEISKYGSEEFRKQLPDVLQDKYPVHDDRQDKKYTKFINRMKEIRDMLRLERKRAHINEIISQHGPLRGDALIRALRSAGIYIPRQFELLELGLELDHNDIPFEALKLMIAAYGWVPFRYYDSSTLRQVHFFEQPNYECSLVQLAITPSGGVVQRFRTVRRDGATEAVFTDSGTLSVNLASIFSFNLEQVPKELHTKPKSAEAKPQIQWLNPPPTLAEYLSPTHSSTHRGDPFDGWDKVEDFGESDTAVDETYEEEEPSPEETCEDEGHDWGSDGVCDRCGYECEHDRYNNDGTCVECGYYDNDYDNDRDDD